MGPLSLGGDPGQHNATIIGSSDSRPGKMRLMAFARVGHLQALSKRESTG
jgi:hypothetical protein